MTWYMNYYRHCGEHWRCEWDSMCDDECPVCGAPIEPFNSEEAEDEADPGVDL